MERAGLGALTPPSSSLALPRAPAEQLQGWEPLGSQAAPQPSDIPADAMGCSLHRFKSVYCYQLIYSPLSAMLGGSFLFSRSSSVSACTKQHLAQVPVFLTVKSLLIALLTMTA